MPNMKLWKSFQHLTQRLADPIKKRERALQKQLHGVQSQIDALDEESRKTQQLPRVRSTVRPGKSIPPQNPFSAGQEWTFEPEASETAKPRKSLEVATLHYNEHGVKKLDAVHLWRWLRNCFRRTPSSRSKFVDYLAAGSIQGIRPLRYERRIARNRFLALFVLLLVLLFGILVLLQNPS